MKRFFAVTIAMTCAAAPVLLRAQPPKAPACDPDNGGLTLPSGFCALVVSDGVGGGARHIAVASNGDIFVSLRTVIDNRGHIVALRDTNGDGRPDVTERFGVKGGTGLKFHDGYLYYATTTSIERFKMAPGDLKPSGGPEVIVSGLPGAGGHSDKSIVFDERGNIYVNVGMPSNACADMGKVNAVGDDPCPLLDDGGGIWRFKADVVGQKYSRGARYASGMRQPLALAWLNGTLYSAMNSRDSLNRLFPSKFTDEDNAKRPLEPLLEIREGDVFGWPYCWLDGKTGQMILAPEYGGDGNVVGRCTQYKAPVASFPAHWAPVDLMPYTGTQFPARYRGGLFMASHGSHDRTPVPEEGFNVTFQAFANGKVSGTYEVFADGFRGATPVVGRTGAIARPDGTAQGPDGSLYIVESNKGKIWRVMYKGQAQAQGEVPALPATVTAKIAAARAAGGELWPAAINQLCVPLETHPGPLEPRIPPPPSATPPARDTWYREPEQVFDNMYVLATKSANGGVSAWAIKTSAGIILIDAGYDYSVKEQVDNGLRTLGLNPADIKAVFVTHNHRDHVGGARYLQDLYKPHIYLSAADWDIVRTQNPTDDPKGPPIPTRDLNATDGQKYTLGDTTITVYITPGHTPGTLSFLIPVKIHGVPHVAAFWGGTGMGRESGAPNLTLNNASAKRLDGLARQAKADILLSNHDGFSEYFKRNDAARTNPSAPNPFVVGVDGVSRLFQVVQRCGEANVAALQP